MVAYSFNKMFVPQVEQLVKRQTVRGPRKRHTRPGEPVQLYTAMRTRHCRKLVDPDPTCARVDHIAIAVGGARVVPEAAPGTIERIEINGVVLNGSEIEEFAVADGFGLDWQRRAIGTRYAWHEWVSPRVLMGIFWVTLHGPIEFEGNVIHWAP